MLAEAATWSVPRDATAPVNSGIFVDRIESCSKIVDHMASLHEAGGDALIIDAEAAALRSKIITLRRSTNSAVGCYGRESEGGYGRRSCVSQSATACWFEWTMGLGYGSGIELEMETRT